jgi:long-chain acyl-CoA synthetase
MNLRLKTAGLRPLLQRLKPTLYLGQAYLYPLIEPIEATIIGAESRFIVGDVTGMQSARSWSSLLDTKDEVTIPRNTEFDAPVILLPTSGTTGSSKFVTHSPTTLSKIAKAFG